ncbi:MAG: hypothetical protein IGS39_08100 [Calothrix sp. C42_A2020_038]|nr:hypothetical protein [Calothrix sp. C42_A2020_038]
MKKQCIFNSLSAVFIVYTALLTMPKFAHAGINNVTGASVDSSGYSGTFHPSNQQTIPQVAPNTSIKFDDTGLLKVSNETLKEFDKINSQIRESFQNQNNVVINLMLGNADAGVAGLQFKTALVELGADPDTVDKLKNALSDLLPDCQSQSLPTCKSIDINKLNQLITVHNQLVRTSPPAVLVKISQHPYFQDLFAQLKNLRQALSLK